MSSKKKFTPARVERVRATDTYKSSYSAPRNQTDKLSKPRLATSSIVLRVLSLVFLLVLFTSLVMKLQGNSSTLTFESFINFISTAPQISPSFAVIPKFTADIGIFQFFADFINYLSTILNILVFLFKNLLNLITYVVWFFGWVFSV